MAGGLLDTLCWRLFDPDVDAALQTVDGHRRLPARMHADQHGIEAFPLQHQAVVGVHSTDAMEGSHSLGERTFVVGEGDQFGNEGISELVDRLPTQSGAVHHATVPVAAQDGSTSAVARHRSSP